MRTYLQLNTRYLGLDCKLRHWQDIVCCCPHIHHLCCVESTAPIKPSNSINLVIEHCNTKGTSSCLHAGNGAPRVSSWVIHVNRPNPKTSIESSDGINTAANNSNPASASSSRHLGQVKPSVILKIIALNTSNCLWSLTTNCKHCLWKTNRLSRFGLPKVMLAIGGQAPKAIRSV